MFKQLMFVVLSFGILSTLTADDTIPGGNVSGTWYAANSPYYIAGNITIPAGDTLTIEPAVQVNFLGGSLCTVNGWLEAVGTEADSIRFAGTAMWYGVNFVNAPDTSHLVYCRLDNAFTAVTCNNSDPVISHGLITGGGGVFGAIYVSNSGSPRISDCIIINNASRGIYWTSSANAAIDRCVISNIGGQGIFSIGGASLTISGSTISGCGQSGVYKTSGNWTFIDCTISNNKNNVNYGGGVHSEYGNVTFTNCTISNDTTLTGEGGGVACRNGTATFTNCTINGNHSNDLSSSPYIGGGGISLYHANAVLSHCTLFDNWGTPHGGGIAIDTGNLSIDHCTIDRNNSDCGMYPGSAIVIIGGGNTADITNSIISNNYGWTSNACAVYNQGSLTVDYSDFYNNTLGGHISGNIPPGFGVLDTTNYNGDSCDVYCNIFMEPMYADTVNRDYHLAAGSPCIDAGDPLFAYDPDSTITDMGAYFYDQSEPSIALSANALDFGSVTVGQSADLPLLIYNLGNANLLVSDISNNLGVYTHNWNPLDSLIVPNDSLEITVTFTPDDTLTFTDTLWIDNNDTLCCVTLAGQGLPVGVAEGILTIPREFALRQPLPNPCKSFARIQFELPEASAVDLSVYDVSGRLVSRLITGLREAGIHDAILDASSLSAGVYFYRLKASGYTAIRKIIVTK